MKYIIIIFLLLVSSSSCKRKWTDEDRKEFVAGCMGNASRDSLVGTRFARSYCDCLVQRIEAKFPNANDVKYIRYDTAARQIGVDCLSTLQQDSIPVL